MQTLRDLMRVVHMPRRADTHTEVYRDRRRRQTGTQDDYPVIHLLHRKREPKQQNVARTGRYNTQSSCLNP